MAPRISNIKSPRWGNAEKTIIDVDVTIAGVGDNIPYTIAKSDPLFAEASTGKYGNVADFSVPQNIDYTWAITGQTHQMMEKPYGVGAKRTSVNNYLAQLAALKAIGTIKPDQQADLDALLKAADWEQTMLDRRDELLKTPDEATFRRSQLDSTWPPFPDDAAKVVALC